MIRKHTPTVSMRTVQDKAKEEGKIYIFRRIPDWILRAPRSSEYKIVYALLLSYKGVNETAWPGWERLCNEAQVSRSTLAKVLDELEKDGLITKRTRRGMGRTNVYE